MPWVFTRPLRSISLISLGMRSRSESGSFIDAFCVSLADLHSSQYIQLIIIPIAFTFCGFIGIAVTSVGSVLYGGIFWDPLRLINNWDNRAATFFASFVFFLATLGTNISANSLCAGNDMTVLFPRVRLFGFPTTQGS